MPIYESIQIGYSGPQGGIDPSNAAEEALRQAEKKAGQAVESLGSQWRVEYSYPDGSLLLQIRFEHDPGEKLYKALEDQGLRLVYRFPIEDPHCRKKRGTYADPSVADLFELKYPQDKTP